MELIVILASLLGADGQPQPKCWASQGNWQNAAVTSCAFNSRDIAKPRARIKDDDCPEHVKK